jgi:hypothetical protein
MFTAREILYTTALPGALALLVLAVAWRPWRRSKPVLRGHWGGGPAAGAAFGVGYALLDGEVPAWPPAQARHWLFYLAAGLAVLGMLDAAVGALVHVPRWVRAEVALVASGAIVVCLFASLLQADTWPPLRAVEWVVGMVVVLHLAWVSTELLVDRLPRGAGAAVLFVFCAGAALVLMLSGSLVYGRLAGVLSAVAFAAVLISFAAPGFSPARGAVAVIVPVTVAVLFLGYHLADLDALNGTLVLAALLLPWLTRLPWLAGRRASVRVVVALLLAALPVGLAGWRAGQAFVKAQQERSAGEAL